eukprot:COSAG02_NODE_51889_length_311_cov_0.754717_1_plen_47_part_01
MCERQGTATLLFWKGWSRLKSPPVRLPVRAFGSTGVTGCERESRQSP